MVRGVTPEPEPLPTSLDPDVPGELLADDHLIDPGAYAISADETEAEELTETEAEAPEDVDDPEQLSEAKAVAAVAASSRPVRKAAAPVKKDHPTPKQKSGKAAGARKGTSPAQFVRESAAELRKVVWPTWSQLVTYFVAVLVFVVIVIAFVGGLDLLFGQLLLKALG